MDQRFVHHDYGKLAIIVSFLKVSTLQQRKPHCFKAAGGDNSILCQWFLPRRGLRRAFQAEIADVLATAQRQMRNRANSTNAWHRSELFLELIQEHNPGFTFLITGSPEGKVQGADAD